MTHTIVFDLETTVDPAMPPFVPRENASPFPPAPFWHVRVIGYAWLDEQFCTRRIGCVEGESEETIVRAFVAMTHKRRPTLVGYNSRGFDLPVLGAACMRRGVPWPWRFGRDVSYRYSLDGHLDVADVLTDFGAGKYASLDSWARVVGMPGKLATNGGDVAGLLEAGEIERVRAYCMEDVVQTTAIALRFYLLRGTLDVANYQAAARSLVAAVDADARLLELGAAINRPRFLLEGVVEEQAAE